MSPVSQARFLAGTQKAWERVMQCLSGCYRLRVMLVIPKVPGTYPCIKRYDDLDSWLAEIP